LFSVVAEIVDIM